MSALKHPDVLVVGNGVLGLSTAIALLRRNPSLAVTVVGDGARTAGATPAAGAMFGCFGEVTASGMRTEFGRMRLDHAIEARNLWPDWLGFILDATGQKDPLVTATSTNIILNTVGYSKLDSRNFQAILTALRDNGEAHEEIDPSEIEWLEPTEPGRPLRAIHINNEGSIDAGLLLIELATCFTRLGGILVDGEVERIRGPRDADSTTVVMRNGSELSAHTVVLCTGARLTELLSFDREIALRVPRVTSGVGFSALASLAEGAGPSTVIRTPNRAFACGLHVVPRGDGRVYLGATNAVELTPRAAPSIDEVLFLLQCATEQINVDLNWATIDRMQVGNRPVSIDGQPVIGRTSRRSLWTLSGTYRDGLHCSPVYADRLAEAILNDASHVRELAAFTPERELLASGTREEVISDLVDHTMATGYERPWRLPAEWPLLIEGMTHRSFSAFADTISEQYTPPADILTLLRFSPEGVKSDFAQYFRDVYCAWN